MIKEIKKGDYLKCIKEYHTDGAVFGQGGFSIVLEVNQYNVVVDGNILIPKSAIEEHFLVDNENLSILAEDKGEPIVTLPPYYDNSQGSLYQIATQRGWNAYTFDIVKRLDRGGKKDPLRQEIEKSIGVLKLWLKEINN